MDNKAIVERIKEVMEHYDLSAPKLAQKLGITHTAIYNTLKEKYDVAWVIVAGIADTFPKVSMDWLLKGEGSMFGAEMKKEVQTSLQWQETLNQQRETINRLKDIIVKYAESNVIK